MDHKRFGRERFGKRWYWLRRSLKEKEKNECRDFTESKAETGDARGGPERWQLWLRDLIFQAANGQKGQETERSWITRSSPSLCGEQPISFKVGTYLLTGIALLCFQLSDLIHSYHIFTLQLNPVILLKKQKTHNVNVFDIGSKAAFRWGRTPDVVQG